MRLASMFGCATLVFGLALATAADGLLTYPAAARRPVTDVYHGVSVSEDYRWLENTSATEVRDWIASENALTRGWIDARPRHKAIFEELTSLLGQAPVTRTALRHAQGKLFALKRQPPANQPRLVVLADPMNPSFEKVLLDPNVLNPKGTTAIDWYSPSLDGRTVAVSLSDNGSEDGTLHLFDVASGRALPDVIPGVQRATAGGSVAWAPGSRGLYYTRYPQGHERPPADANFYQQVWFHRLGTPISTDRYVIGKELPRIAEIALSSTEDGRYLLADVSNGDGGENAFYLRNPAGQWARIADFSDGVREMALGRDGRWYARIVEGSPRGRIVAAPLDTPRIDRATLVVAEGSDTIAGLTPTAHRLYVSYLAGGPEELRAYTLDGKPLGRSAPRALPRPPWASPCAATTSSSAARASSTRSPGFSMHPLPRSPIRGRRRRR